MTNCNPYLSSSTRHPFVSYWILRACMKALFVSSTFFKTMPCMKTPSSRGWESPSQSHWHSKANFGLEIKEGSCSWIFWSYWKDHPFGWNLATRCFPLIPLNILFIEFLLQVPGSPNNLSSSFSCRYALSHGLTSVLVSVAFISCCELKNLNSDLYHSLMSLVHVNFCLWRMSLFTVGQHNLISNPLRKETKTNSTK